MARIRLGSLIREGSRSGTVVAHRPGGMVDVRFDDVTWIERRPEKNLMRRNPAPDYYDLAKEQFRRQQMAIYESQLKRGLSDEEAWQSSFAIATRQGQKYGWLKPGTQEPTAKGRRGAKQKLKTADAREKRQRYEQELSRRRKSGTYRIVPERHGSETWFIVQPGGKYFKGKGGMRRAKDYVAALIEEQVHGNPRDTRRLSERGAGAYRQLGSLPKTARDLLPRARALGRKRGGLVKKLLAVPPSKKQKFQIQRARLTRQIEDVDEDFKALLKKVSYGIGEDERAVQRSLTTLHREFVAANNKASGQSRLNPRRKRTRDIYKAGETPRFLDARSGSRPPEMAPFLARSREERGKRWTYTFAWEGRSRKIPRILKAANEREGYGARFRKVRNVTNVVWKEHPYANVGRYGLVQVSKRPSVWRVYDNEKKQTLGGIYSGPTGKRDAEKALARRQAKAKKEFVELVGDRITAFSTTSESRARLLQEMLVQENVNFDVKFKWGRIPKRLAPKPKKPKGGDLDELWALMMAT